MNDTFVCKMRVCASSVCMIIVSSPPKIRGGGVLFLKFGQRGGGYNQ